MPIRYAYKRCISSMQALLETAAEHGPLAHFHVAQVAREMFQDEWVYRMPMGWRARTDRGLYMGQEASLYIKRKLSEDVAAAFVTFAASATDAKLQENALHIAARLKNASYKNDVIEEAASLFLEH